MAWNFRKRVKILPGVTLNFSKKGTSWSFGPRGAKVNVSKRGTYLTTGIPGTGLYSREKISGSHTTKASPSYSAYDAPIHSYFSNPNAMGCGIFATSIIASFVLAFLTHNLVMIPAISGVGLFVFAITSLLSTDNTRGQEELNYEQSVAEAQGHAKQLNSLLEQLDESQTLDSLSAVHNQIIELMNNHLKGKPIKFSGLSYEEALIQIENEYIRKITEISKK